MFVILSGVDTADGEPTHLEAWKQATRSLQDRLGSYYEAYMNGLIKVEFGEDGEIVSVWEVDYGYDYGYGSSVC